MRVMLSAIKKELRQLSRNKALLVIIFSAPVIIMGIIPFSLEKEVKINLSVVDKSKSSEGRLLKGRIGASPHIRLTEYGNFEEAIESLRSGDSEMAMLIPSDMNEELSIALDATHPLNAQSQLALFEQILRYNSSSGEDWLKELQLFNPTLDGRVWLMMSLLILLVTLIGCCLITLNIVSEKESGMWEQLRATPLSPTLYIVSKIVVYGMVSLFAMGNGLLICRLLFGFTSAGSSYNLWLLTVIFLWPILMIGVGIASISKNQLQAIYLLVLILLSTILMSTMFSFLNAMPAWARALRFINPLYYMLDASKIIVLKGFSLQHVKWQLAALIIQGTLLSGLVFRSRITKI